MYERLDQRAALLAPAAPFQIFTTQIASRPLLLAPRTLQPIIQLLLQWEGLFPLEAAAAAEEEEEEEEAIPSRARLLLPSLATTPSWWDQRHSPAQPLPAACR